MNKFFDSTDITNKYLKYRHKYNAEFADIVMKYCDGQPEAVSSLSCKLDVMVDVGCGSGQSTNIFQPYFKEILGIDISHNQIELAKKQNKFENIQYLEGCAEVIPVPDHSVDLVLAGAAAHWFDLPKFFKEVKRVLKPNVGCMAIASYEVPSLNLISSPNEILMKKSYQLLKRVVKECFENQSKPTVARSLHHALSRYADIFEAIPFDTKQRNDNCHLLYLWSVTDVCGWITSLSAYQIYVEEQMAKLCETYQDITKDIAEEIDPINQLRKDLLDLWNLKNDSLDDKIFEADFNVFILLARNEACNDVFAMTTQ